MNNNWNYDIFDNLFEWKEKSHIKSGDGKASGKYKMFVCSDTEIKYFDEYLEQGESLIFGTGGKASCHFTDEKFAYSTDCVVAQKLNDFLHTKFYYYYFRRNNIGELQNTFTGSGLQHTSKKKIGAISVPIPSLDEQQRIVDKIDELFSKLDKSVEELNKIKDQLKIYRQAVLKEAFDGKFISNDNWETNTIEYVCRNIVDCPHSTPKWVSNGMICLRTTNFKRGYLDMSEKYFVSEKTFEDRISRLKPLSGDVLYSREGAILGIACIIPENLDVCLGQRMMLLRTNEKMINKFLMYYLNSPKLVNYVEKLKGGSASPHVNVGDIKKFLIPIPTVAEQLQILKNIESRLSVCDNLEKTVNESLQKAESLRQSILKQAFEGKLI